MEFEKELENKFGGDVPIPTRDIGDDIEEIGTWENSSQNVSKIRKQYEKKFAAGQESGESVCSIFVICTMENATVMFYDRLKFILIGFAASVSTGNDRKQRFICSRSWGIFPCSSYCPL